MIRLSSYISTPLFERNRNTANGHCSGFIDNDDDDEEDDDDEDETGGGGGELSLPPPLSELEEALVFTSV
jgi:hypothetical protein